MHIAIGVLIILTVWLKGDWRNWRNFHSTMLYFALGNLLYNFLCANHLLWRLKPDFFPNHSITEVIYTVVTFPATALLFLSNYPIDNNKKIVYYLKWIIIYIGIEWFFTTNDRIVYQHGWSLLWSFIFDLTLFPMLRLHYKNPLLAYGLSIIFCVFWVWLFDVPVNVPIGKRGG